MYMYPF